MCVKKIRNFIVAVMVTIFAFTGTFLPTYASVNENFQTIDLQIAQGSSYEDYLKVNKAEVISDCEILCDITSVTDGEIIKTPSGESAAFGDDSKTITFTFNVEQDGLYMLTTEYFSGYSEGVTAERTIHIDGKLPYNEAVNVVFYSYWTDGKLASNERRFELDKQGNEILPDNNEQNIKVSSVAFDAGGYYQIPLQFYLTKGTHTLSYVPGRGNFAVSGFKLSQFKKTATYKEYLEQFSNQEIVTDYESIVEAEDYSHKSNSSLLPVNDKTSAATSPSSPSKIILNTVGGTSWSVNGQWIEWDFKVSKSGMYRIGVRYLQNFLSGMVSNRKLTIDGVLPFEEASKISFPYSSSWKVKIMGNEQTEFLFYLSEGKHTIRLEATLGDLSTYLRSAEEIVDSLNTSYRQLVMYMGSDPDVNRDYKIEEMLPQVMDNLAANEKALKKLSDDIILFSGDRGGANVAIDNLYDCVGKMHFDSRDIPSLLSNFHDYIAALSTWVQTQSAQSLQLDSVFLLGENGTTVKASGGFFANLIYSIKSFLASFITDYSSLNSSDNEKQIEVWVNSGRDQAQIIKDMVNNYFIPETGIGVNLKLVSGQLLLATMAGVGPDVSLFNNAADVMNFAYRNAAEPLEKYDGFDELKNNYSPSAWVPVSSKGNVYAIPEMQSFFVMFYRSDVLSELKLPLPQTWDELYGVIGELQRKNLEFGFPNSIYSYGLMLYQNGGRFYNDEKTATDLSSNEAIKAFQNWTRLYTSYKLPYEYSDINRFRSGEMPLLIGDYTLYYNLAVSAPEIKGKWGFTLVPGIKNTDGTINRSVATTTVGTMMMSSSEDKQSAWEFIKWWNSEEMQTVYANNLETRLGVAARYSTANMHILKKLNWNTREANVLVEQSKYAIAIEELPGSYYLNRYIENAFRRVVNYNDDERETLVEYAEQIDKEIEYKRNELD